MTNPAFNKGFVKRALEHGYTEKQAGGLLDAIMGLNFGPMSKDPKFNQPYPSPTPQPSPIPQQGGILSALKGINFGPGMSKAPQFNQPLPQR